MIHFIMKHDLIQMLIEDSRERITLDFEINKDISLRNFIGPDQFKKLIRATVDVLGEDDYETCICLLDKIKESEMVLKTIIKLQFSQIQNTKPQRFVSPAENTHDHNSQYRIFEESKRPREGSDRAMKLFRLMIN